MYRRQCCRKSCTCNECNNDLKKIEPINVLVEKNDCCSTYNYQDSCEYECGFKHANNGLPENPVLAQAYVPIQHMNRTFIPEVGLKMGTIFPELVRPYVPNQSMAEKEFIEAANVAKGRCNHAY